MRRGRANFLLFSFFIHISSHSGRHHCVAYGNLWTRNFQATKHDDEILWINFGRPISLVQPENSHLLADMPRIIHIENQLRISTHSSSVRCIFMNSILFSFMTNHGLRSSLLRLIHEKYEEEFSVMIARVKERSSGREFHICSSDFYCFKTPSLRFSWELLGWNGKKKAIKQEINEIRCKELNGMERRTQKSQKRPPPKEKRVWAYPKINFQQYSVDFLLKNL